MSRERNPVIALVGNPNTGKTSVFNALCGTRQRVGNYPGVTVDRKKGRLVRDNFEAEVIDLPGCYSLRATSPDELLAADTIMGRATDTPPPDLIIYTLDATNLRRNLYLFSQISETGIPVVIALTMADLLEKEGIELDISCLEKQLRIPVVPVNAGNSDEVIKLIETVEKAVETARPPRSFEYPEKLQPVVTGLCTLLNRTLSISYFETANVLFYDHDPLTERLCSIEQTAEQIQEARETARGRDALIPNLITSARYHWARKITEKCEKRNPKAKSLSDRIDAFLTHRVFGLLAFSSIMFLVFTAIYSWAAPFMDSIDLLFATAGSYAGSLLEGYPLLQSLVADGIIGGVGSVLVFLPQILILFALITLLEDSGYLSRASFLMDKLLSWSGLNGRAFIPMLSSFACAIPGIMGTRVMPDKRARLTTILVAPLMSCSARLPVYVLMIGAFIEPQYGPVWAGVTLFLMHMVGPFFALLAAFIFNRGLLKTPKVPFVLEMHPYRLPHWRNVTYRVYEAGKKFTLQTGSIILAFSILIWAAAYFPRPDSIAEKINTEYSQKISEIKGSAAHEQSLEEKIDNLKSEREQKIAATYLENSVLGTLGKAIQPAFEPLGFDWKITVGVLGAFPARELIIATMGILYNLGDDTDEESELLREKLQKAEHPDGRKVFTPLVAITLMVFFALCAQCLATLATAKSELNSTRWPVFMFIYMTTLAYLVAMAVYQVGSALGWGV